MPGEKQTNNVSLTEELSERIKQEHGPRSVTLIIVLCLLFGVGGGMIGSFLAFNNPSLRARLGITKEAGFIQNQSIILNEDSAVIDVVKKDSPAVVSIVVSKDLSQLPGFDFFSPFGGDYSSPNSSSDDKPNIQQVGAGSGFFVSADGIILTNKHVVSDATASYTVITEDGKQHEAKVLAIDPRNDLAIIKIEIQDAPFLVFADSSKLQVGQRVIAIGNSLGQYQNTVTTGVVSGIGRQIVAGGEAGAGEQLDGVIQTDAAINPGNSGGPLLNSAGQVIGINTAVDMQGQLVGFAIPSNDARKALEMYQKTGSIKRPFLGVRYVMVSEALVKAEKLPKDYGALLVQGNRSTEFAVIPGSPADKAGLLENDIILEADGQRLDEDYTLSQALRNKEVGDSVTLKIYSPQASSFAEASVDRSPGAGKGEEKTVKIVLIEAK